MLKRTLSAVALSAALLGSGLCVSPAAAAAVPAPATVYRIMPLGDSITRGGGQVSGQYLGYRVGLQAHLKAGAPGFAYDFVGSRSDKGAPDPNHEGHGGWTIDMLAANVDAWVETYKPDIVLLHAGTNDITRGDSPAGVATELRDLIAQIRGHNAATKIFVAKIIRSRDPNRQSSTDAYAALIPGVVARAGPNVYLVDQTSVAGLDIFDWTHPNEFGYSKMAYNWYRSLNVVVGGGKWKTVPSPYQVRAANICQVAYERGGTKVCQARIVN